MPRNAQLRAVTEADSAPKPPPASLREAAERSERDLLVMMRATISTEIKNGVPAHTLAPLMRQMRDIDKEIRQLDLRVKQEAAEDGVVTDEAWDDAAI